MSFNISLVFLSKIWYNVVEGVMLMKISRDIKYIGVNDRSIDLFEGQYKVPYGISYNSYVIVDRQIAVFDTVDAHFKDKWLSNLKTVLKSRIPDYLIVNHMEPDHSGCISDFMKLYPDTRVVATKMAFDMMSHLFKYSSFDHKIVVKEGDTIDLGKHKLSFIMAPMVHWPEVMMTYESTEKVLFSADAFGRFGANNVKENITLWQKNMMTLLDEKPWDGEARRYYFGIVGKYGVQVQNVLKKAKALDIKMICPLHGPVLTDDIDYYVNRYDTWSSYQYQDRGILLAYASIYGNTKEAITQFYKTLGYASRTSEIVDLARDDFHECIAKAFLYKNLVIASPTYNGGLFPPVKNFIEGLLERNYQNRSIGIVENGLWAPNVENTIKQMFANSKNIRFLEPVIHMKGEVRMWDYDRLDDMFLQF